MADKNLKNEVMSDNELDGVAGGTEYETMKDSQFLHAIGLLDRTYSLEDIEENGDAIRSAVNDAFGKVDMYADASDRYRNTYGEKEGLYGEVGRAEAYKILCQVYKPGFDYKQFL